MAYVTPAHYYPTRERRLRLIVIHTMESPETDDTAENVAGWFAGRSGTAPLASAHACVDNNSVVLCLPPSATAFAAPGCNADGYQIEQAGRAAQGIAGWSDAYSQSMLRLSAAHARQIAQSAGIPLVHLTDAQLAAGQAGFVGHDQVSRVYKRSDHTDPGPTFPWAQYMGLVNQTSPIPPTPTPEPEQDGTEMLTAKDIYTGVKGALSEVLEPAHRAAHLSHLELVPIKQDAGADWVYLVNFDEMAAYKLTTQDALTILTNRGVHRANTRGKDFLRDFTIHNTYNPEA